MENQWLALMGRLGYSSNLDTFSELVAEYSHENRHYHNFSHVFAVLEQFAYTKHLAQDPNAVEVALWFHDAIYKIESTSNESDSARWASNFLQKNGASLTFSSHVSKLIMATAHNISLYDNDQQLIADIDLSILGSSAHIYQNFEDWIRQEYSSIPAFIYDKKRKEVLSSFLDKERIYSHDHFYFQLETSARMNLGRAIAALN